jgi:plasmid rolling circle replication initiator protein Rep
MSNCAERLALAIEHPGLLEQNAWIEQGFFCGARLCPFCEARRSRAWRARVLRGLAEFHAAKPTHKALFLTLTVRNCPVPELRQTLDAMNKGWQRFKECSFFPTKAWLRRTEITLGKPAYGDDLPVAPNRRKSTSKLESIQASLATDPQEAWEAAQLRWANETPWAHPHFHCLLMVPSSYFTHGYVTQTEWQTQWAAAMRLDYAPVVDVRKAYANHAGDNPLKVISAAGVEAAKYLSKAQDILAMGENVCEFHRQIQNVRLRAVSAELGKFIRAGEVSHQEMLDTEEIQAADSPLLRSIVAWDQLISDYIPIA